MTLALMLALVAAWIGLSFLVFGLAAVVVSE